jgi:hypothetical protein
MATKPNQETQDSKKDSSFLVTSTATGALVLLLGAAIYYFYTNVHITP